MPIDIIQAIFHAIRTSNTATLQRLLNEHAADIDFNVIYNESTFLITAVFYGNQDIIKLLLDQSTININTKDSHGKTALTHILLGIDNKKMSIKQLACVTQWLLQAGAESTVDTIDKLVTLIQLAAQSQNKYLWMFMLIRVNTHRNETDFIPPEMHLQRTNTAINMLDLLGTLPKPMQTEITVMCDYINMIKAQLLQSNHNLNDQDILHIFNALLPIFKIIEKTERLKTLQPLDQIWMQHYLSRRKIVQKTDKLKKLEPLNQIWINRYLALHQNDQDYIRYLLVTELYGVSAIGPKNKEYQLPPELLDTIRNHCLDESNEVILSMIESHLVSRYHVTWLLNQLFDLQSETSTLCDIVFSENHTNYTWHVPALRSPRS